MNHPLDRLFNARSIAIIGASAHPDKIGGRPVRYLKETGFLGDIYPVNPKYVEVQGIKCYASVGEIPDDVDVAIIAVPAAASVEAIRECGRKKARFAIIFTAGFAEADEEGRALQGRLLAAAKESGVRIIGPNTAGYSSATAQIIGSFGSPWLREGSLPLPDGSVSFVSHSGAFGTFIYAMAHDAGVEFRHSISVGNEIDVSFAECLEYMVEDPSVKAIGGYLEGIKDGDEFARVALRANELGKPLVIVKVGRSDRSQAAAASHTAALFEGSDDVYRAICDECNIIDVSDVQQMIEILDLCQKDLILHDPGVGVISISGGMGAWGADQLDALGIRMADLSPRTRRDLDEILPKYGSSLNPVDATGQVVNSPEMLKRSLKILNADENVDLILLLMGLQETDGERFAEDVVAVMKDSTTPLVALWVAGPGALYRAFDEGGIPVYGDLYRPLVAIEKLVKYSYRRHRLAEDSETTHRRLLARQDPDDGGRLGAESSKVLSEHDAKDRLRLLGFGVPHSRLVESAEDAIAAYEELGYSLVLKAGARDRLIHKTELGLVRTSLDSEERVRAAYEEIAAAAATHIGPEAEMFIEQEAAEGIEFIVSLLSDDVFGYYVLVGLGGEFVEVLREAGLHRAPLTLAQAGRLLESSPRMLKLLRGARGRKPADLQALMDLIVKVSELPEQIDDHRVLQLELNPVRVHPRGSGSSILDAVWMYE